MRPRWRPTRSPSCSRFPRTRDRESHDRQSEILVGQRESARPRFAARDRRLHRWPDRTFSEGKFLDTRGTGRTRRGLQGRRIGQAVRAVRGHSRVQRREPSHVPGRRRVRAARGRCDSGAVRCGAVCRRVRGFGSAAIRSALGPVGVAVFGASIGFRLEIPSCE